MCQSMNLNEVSSLFTVIFNEFKKYKVHLLFNTRRNYRTRYVELHAIGKKIMHAGANVEPRPGCPPGSATERVVNLN